VDIAIERADARALQKEHARAFVVTNPPYGERLARGAGFERELAQALQRLHGYSVAALAGDRGLLRAIGQTPRVEHALWNGPLECRLLVWEIA
jgi:putative N6-adenine-specific DNA methylase